MEIKFLNNTFRVGNEKKFDIDEISGDNLYYGGILFGTKGGGYALVQWIENPETNEEVLLNSLVEVL